MLLRYAWSHGIVPRKFDIIQASSGLTTQVRGERISFTFRRIRDGDSCRCDFADHCDIQLSEKNRNNLKIDNTVASKLEEVHVHEVHDDYNFRRILCYQSSSLFNFPSGVRRDR